MKIRRLVLSTVALSLFAGAGVAQEGGNSDTMDMALAAGWKASFVCSGTFNADQDLNTIERNDLTGIYPDFQRDYDRLPEPKIDRKAKTVTVQYDATMPPRMAVWRAGFGCTQLPIGATDDAIKFLPKFGSWPTNTVPDRGSAIGSNVKVQLRTEEAVRLEAPVSFAFDERTYGYGTKTSAVLVVQDGQVLAEQYARGINHETPQRTWSVAKSISATILGAARRNGHINLDYEAVIADWNNGADPRRKITLRNLLHMASGLDSGDNGARTDRLYFGGGAVIDQAASNMLEAMPGTRFKYANNDTVIAMRSLRESMKDDAAYHRFPYERLLHKIGATHTTLETDWNGDFISSSQVWTTARDLARIGQLYLQDGMWGNDRLLPEGWAKFVSTPAPAQPSGGAGYGAHFWLMTDAEVPKGTYYMAGNRGQYVVIVPSMNAVIVRRGFDTIGGARFDINSFTRDVLLSLQAAEDERAAEAAEIAAMEAEIEQAIIDEKATRSQRKQAAIRERIMEKYGRLPEPVEAD